MQNKAQGENPLVAGGLAFASLWSMPFTMARMMHDLEINGMHAWARSVWGQGRPHVPHEPANQLEIPEAIADAMEQDLFA